MTGIVKNGIFTCLGLFLAVFLFGSHKALAATYSLPATPIASQTAPTPADSDPNGGHEFYLRSDSTLGNQYILKLVAYYPNTDNWSSQYISLLPGADPSVQCNSNGGSVTVSLSAGASSTSRTLTGNKVCAEDDNSANSNALYTRYYLPSSPPPQDPVTGLYKVSIDVIFNKGSSDGSVLLLLKASSSSIKVGTSGTASNGTEPTYPIVGRPSISTRSTPTGIAIPFGFCGQTSTNQLVELFDADNGSANFPGEYVNFSIKDVTTGNYVTLPNMTSDTGSGGGGFNTAHTVYTPQNGEKSQVKFSMNFSSTDHYAMYIKGLDPSNTIDVGLPAQSVAGDPSVCIPGGGTSTPTSRTTITPNVQGGSEGEVGSNITFSQGATVSNFPDMGDWAFEEAAKSVAINSGIDFSDANDTAQKGAWQANTATFLCHGGTYKTDCTTGGGQYDCFGSDGTEYQQNSCGSVHQYSFKCSDDIGTTKTGYNSDKTPAGCGVYKFECMASWNNWTKDSTNNYFSDDGPTCHNHWTCPNPSLVPDVYNGSASGSGASGGCRIARCVIASDNIIPNNGSSTYTASKNGDTIQYGWYGSGPGYGAVGLSGSLSPDDLSATCTARCSLGYSNTTYNYSPGNYPDPAGTPSDGHLGRGDPSPTPSDPQCWLQPSFQIKCTWTSEATQPYTQYQKVTGDGLYCQGDPNTQVTKTGSFGAVCATSTPSNGGWDSSAPPGLGKAGVPNPYSTYRANWVINTDPLSATGCGYLGTRPFMQVSSGDVQTGEYIHDAGSHTGSDTATCSSADGSIIAWNRHDTDGANYNGSGTTTGVVALGNISGFVSGATTLSPKGLTFANTDGSLTYGGNFGTFNSLVDCSAIQGLINGDNNSSAAISGNDDLNDGGATSVAGNGTTVVSGGIVKNTPSTNPAQGGTIVINGNLWIANNVTYGSATSLAKLPYLRLIVLGNIYVSNSVTRLDGDYIAVDTNGSDGKIFTCSSGMNAPIDYTTSSDVYHACGQQLTINGSLTARKVVFGRSYGTLSQNTAAETINYGPASWLPRGANLTDIGSPYQNITGLPPAL